MSHKFKWHEKLHCFSFSLLLVKRIKNVNIIGDESLSALSVTDHQTTDVTSECFNCFDNSIFN